MIYIVEDDQNIQELERYVLESAGHQVQCFSESTSFFAACRTQLPQLAILDIMLPGEDGLAILRALRSDPRTAALPVMMATAKNAEMDAVRGLEDGADDYISKPFGVMEFSARVKALLRRSQPAQPAEVLDAGGVHMDLRSRIVTADGRPVELTFKEFELLHMLMRQTGAACGRGEILHQVWGTDFEGESRTLDMHIRTLRQKLGAAGSHIETVRKVGFRFAP